MHKQNTSRDGFTIVELLIVLIVIAILAAISIVAYTGVQNKARTTRAQDTGTVVLEQAIAYQVAQSFYPPTRAAFDSIDVSKLPADIQFVFGSPNASNGQTGVKYEICNGSTGSNSRPAGIKVSYYNYTNGGQVFLEQGEAYDCSGVDPI